MLNAAELIAFLRVRDGEKCQSVDMSFTGRIQMSENTQRPSEYIKKLCFKPIKGWMVNYSEEIECLWGIGVLSTRVSTSIGENAFHRVFHPTKYGHIYNQHCLKYFWNVISNKTVLVIVQCQVLANLINISNTGEVFSVTSWWVFTY